jgi:hypothetical protein
MLSKQTGLWRPNVQIHAYSPGFETNDIGFMQRSDVISSHALMQYVNEGVTSRYRERQVWFGTWMNRNFDGDTIERGVFVDHFATLANYWTYNASLFLSPAGIDDRLARGGPAIRTPASWSGNFGIGSDFRKRYSFDISAHLEGAGDGSWDRSAGVTFRARPSPNLSMSISPWYRRAHDYTGYVTSFADASATGTYGRRYVFADLDEEGFELATRVDWILHSRLSFQLFLQPFIAAGDYNDYRSLVAARTRDFEPYTATVASPDFNFHSVRGSAVMRWEFRPGSALFVVWNENRADVLPRGDLRLGRDLRAISDAPSEDVFLVKVSYWLPM